MKISNIQARQVFDSRGNPTVEVDLVLQNGSMGRAIVPSGASTGKYEALELRDGLPDRFLGKSVFRAIEHIHQILRPALVGMDSSQQREIDDLMREIDGTADKSRIGANAILGVSMAVAHAAASANQLPLYRYLHDQENYIIPMPMIQIIGGGLHAGNIIDLQDFLVIPLMARSFAQAMEMTYNVYAQTRKIFEQRGMSIAVSDEGGFWPAFPSNETALEVLTEAIEKAGYHPGSEVAIALDIAASHFYNGEVYTLSADRRQLDPEAFVQWQEQMVAKYPIISIEDGCAEDDWNGWKKLTDALGSGIQLIGDDLFVTNTSRIERGVHAGVANAVLIKMNQIGTLTETMDAIRQTQEAGYRPIISARSGETEDTTMVDLCLATGAGQIKVGSITRSERLAKYNALLRIEEALGDRAIMARPFEGL